jgi:hypothetical protein
MRPGRKANHSLPSNAEVKECVELYLHSPDMPSWHGAQLRKKHRDNFTFTFPLSEGVLNAVKPVYSERFHWLKADRKLFAWKR